MANVYRKLMPKLDLVGVHATPLEATFAIEYLKDLNPRRAARAVGLHVDEGHELLQKPNVKAMLSHALHRQLEVSAIDVAWLLEQLVENHYLARDSDNLSASNKALESIGKLASIDAFAAEKVATETSDVAERLRRGRERLLKEKAADSKDVAVSFWEVQT